MDKHERIKIAVDAKELIKQMGKLFRKSLNLSNRLIYDKDDKVINDQLDKLYDNLYDAKEALIIYLNELSAPYEITEHNPKDDMF